MRKIIKKEKGITLIALVITIIVLLILAGVTINLTLGENGIFKIAESGKKQFQEAEEKEAISLAVTASKMKDTTGLKITQNNLEIALQEQFGNALEFTITDNGDGSFIIKLDNNRMYYVESSGKIIGNDDILKISTVDELKAFRDKVNEGNTFEGKYIYLKNDITLDITEEWEPIGLYPMDSDTPANENNTPFKGVFDGQGYEINGIYINTTNKTQGLFGLVENGKVLNLGIGENNNITGGSGTAGVVGYLYNGGTISNCYNKSNITGYFAGGIAGCSYYNTTILNCYNTGTITGQKDRTGGIAGMSSGNAKIERAYNLGTIVCEGQYSGGIVGLNTINSTIKDSYNLAKVTGNYNVGGIVGQNKQKSIIDGCYNEGDIESTTTEQNSNTGGIVGFNDGTNGSAVVLNCYSKGTVKGNNNNVGGILGLNRGNLKNSYNIGTIENTTSKCGGIVGNNNKFIYESQELIGVIDNSYSLENSLIDICGTNTGIISEECSEKNSTELKGLVSILGDSFKEDTNNINNGYPVLNWQ